MEIIMVLCTALFIILEAGMFIGNMVCILVTFIFVFFINKINNIYMTIGKILFIFGLGIHIIFLAINLMQTMNNSELFYYGTLLWYFNYPIYLFIANGFLILGLLYFFIGIKNMKAFIVNLLISSISLITGVCLNYNYLALPQNEANAGAMFLFIIPVFLISVSIMVPMIVLTVCLKKLSTVILNPMHS